MQSKMVEVRVIERCRKVWYCSSEVPDDGVIQGPLLQPVGYPMMQHKNLETWVVELATVV